MEPDNETHLITATDVAGNTVSFRFGLFKIYNVRRFLQAQAIQYSIQTGSLSDMVTALAYCAVQQRLFQDR